MRSVLADGEQLRLRRAGPKPRKLRTDPQPLPGNSMSAWSPRITDFTHSFARARPDPVFISLLLIDDKP